MKFSWNVYYSQRRQGRGQGSKRSWKEVLPDPQARGQHSQRKMQDKQDTSKKGRSEGEDHSISAVKTNGAGMGRQKQQASLLGVSGQLN